MQLSDFHKHNLHQKPRIPQLLHPLQRRHLLLHHQQGQDMKFVKLDTVPLRCLMMFVSSGWILRP